MENNTASMEKATEASAQEEAAVEKEEPAERKVKVSVSSSVGCVREHN